MTGAMGLASDQLTGAMGLGDSLFTTRDVRLPSLETSIESLKQTIDAEGASLTRDLEKCKWLIISASGFLVIGAGCVAAAFAVVLFPK